MGPDSRGIDHERAGSTPVEKWVVDYIDETAEQVGEAEGIVERRFKELEKAGKAATTSRKQRTEEALQRGDHNLRREHLDALVGSLAAYTLHMRDVMVNLEKLPEPARAMFRARMKACDDQKTEFFTANRLDEKHVKETVDTMSADTLQDIARSMAKYQQGMLDILMEMEEALLRAGKTLEVTKRPNRLHAGETSPKHPERPPEYDLSDTFHQLETDFDDTAGKAQRIIGQLPTMRRAMFQEKYNELMQWKRQFILHIETEYQNAFQELDLRPQLIPVSGWQGLIRTMRSFQQDMAGVLEDAEKERGKSAR